MGWLSVVIALLAAALLFRGGHIILGTLAVVDMVGAFWSWAVMHNFATESAKRRPDYSGGFYDLTAQDADAIPDWIATVNMAFAGLGVILLVLSLILGRAVPWWGKWSILLLAYLLLFMFWGYVPTQRLDRHIPWMNPVGRPFLDTLVLTGAPAVLARLWGLPCEWLLIPIATISSLYATLAGRVIWRFKVIAASVCIVINCLIWLALYMA